MSRLAPPVSDSVAYGTTVIDFTVVRADRSTLGIAVLPDGSVEVRAPEATPPALIRDRVHARARWITRQRERFADFGVPPVAKEYVAGETHRYLGRQFRLRVDRVSSASERGVRLSGRYLLVKTTSPNDAGTTRRLVERWYRDRAETELLVRSRPVGAGLARYGLPPVNVEVRRMDKRWGSCTPSGRVLLNPLLVCVSPPCIEYVVAHELCHLIHPNHSPTFYEILHRVMPDWRERKQALERSEL